MKNLNSIAADLFNKIRGRFPSVEIGDADGNITTVPEESRFYDFDFVTDNVKAGKVSISLDEENGISVIVGKDIVDGQTDSVKEKWFDFLRTLRQFARKRMMQFDVRDINKSNLQKRDYRHLAATRPGEDNMAESRMYGTNKTSYQRIGNARLAIKHNAPVNTESVGGRTQKIDSIFIESPSGEKFRYPFKHLSGARAMAMHVSEGGNTYDDFGKYISGLSEELSKLRKFNNYLNRSGVMAETLGAYTDIVKERTQEIRKQIACLQKESCYRQTVENFEPAVVEDVPDDVAENWIDQLTIRQFNEELKDVFPYIYRLVGEATKARELDPEDLEEDEDPCWKGYKMAGTKKKGGKSVPNCVPEGMEAESTVYTAGRDFNIEDQYGGYVLGYEEDFDDDRRAYDWGIFKQVGGKQFQRISAVRDPESEGKRPISRFSSRVPSEAFQWTVDNVLNKTPEEAEFESTLDELMGQFSEKTKASPLDRAIAYAGTKDASADMSVDKKAYAAAKHKAKKPTLKKAPWEKEAGEMPTISMDPTGGMSMEPEKPKTPIGEFILSFFDRETGKFPKGETAVLTAVEKDYGDEYVEPARQFIEQIQATTLEYLARETSQSRYPETEMIKRLAGI